MGESPRRQMTPVPHHRVRIDGGFWGPRVEANRTVTIPFLREKLQENGCFDALKLGWKPGMPNPPHIFWESDIAKWLEAASYSLATHPDPLLERQVDEAIALLAGAQQPDGYLNAHFTVVEPGKRWTNLRDQHELYCAGHLIEAAVAHFHATGKRSLLDVMRRYADLIDATFGPGPGKKRGYPGHEELEMALVKLYRATGERRYLKLASYFIDERGNRPHYYELESRARGEAPEGRTGYPWDLGHKFDYLQAHVPVREQKTAEGHAVRAMYLFSAMADVAGETGDASLLTACRALWRNVTSRRMYVTGGLGPLSDGERFTVDYDLPNDTAYAETCAAIGLVFWAHRMLQIEPDAAYGDVLERALYNGVLSGVSLKGDTFFYANPLSVHPEHPYFKKRQRIKPYRQPWYDTACCPPNVSRLIASLGQYAYSESESAAWVHLFVNGDAELRVGGVTLGVRQETRYPWDGKLALTLQPERPAAFTLRVRVPGWCGRATASLNGEAIAPIIERGYARIDREWRPGDRLELDMEMPVRRVYAHPRVAADAGKAALQRGPLVYCLEEADNGPGLAAFALPRDARLETAFEAGLLGGIVTLNGEAVRLDEAGWGESLYRQTASPAAPARLKAVPYALWCNRQPGEMMVWIPER